MKLNFPPRMFLTLFFIGAACYAIVAAASWPFSIRLFPWIAGFGLLGLSVAQLIKDLLAQPQGGGGRIMDFQFAEGVDPAVARRRVLIIMGWLIGFVFTIWFLGFNVAIPAIVFLYMKVQGKESWILTIIMTAIAYLFLWGLFDHALHLPFPEPFLFGLFK